MISIHQIQNSLRETFIDLCEACFSEQEWLEENHFPDPNMAKPDRANRSAIAGLSGSTPGSS